MAVFIIYLCCKIQHMVKTFQWLGNQFSRIVYGTAAKAIDLVGFADESKRIEARQKLQKLVTEGKTFESNMDNTVNEGYNWTTWFMLLSSLVVVVIVLTIVLKMKNLIKK